VRLNEWKIFTFILRLMMCVALSHSAHRWLTLMSVAANILKLTLTSNKRLHNFVIEMGPRTRTNNFSGVLMRHRILIYALTGERIVDVGKGDDAGREWNVFTGQAERIALAVPPLMVREGNFARCHEKGIITPDTANGQQRVAPNEWMLANYVSFLVGQSAGFEQHRIGYSDLADVVQR
jgi:hypothetical protein